MISFHLKLVIDLNVLKHLGLFPFNPSGRKSKLIRMKPSFCMQLVFKVIFLTRSTAEFLILGIFRDEVDFMVLSLYIN